MPEPVEPIVPQKLDYATPQPLGINLYKLASAHWWLGFWIVMLLVSGAATAFASDWAFLCALCLLIPSIVLCEAYAILIANTTRRRSWTIYLVLSLLLIWPVNFLMLIAINAMGRKVLRQHGVRMGFLGADMKQFRITDRNSNAI